MDGVLLFKSYSTKPDTQGSKLGGGGGEGWGCKGKKCPYQPTNIHNNILKFSLSEFTTLPHSPPLSPAPKINNFGKTLSPYQILTWRPDAFS